MQVSYAVSIPGATLSALVVGQVVVQIRGLQSGCGTDRRDAVRLWYRLEGCGLVVVQHTTQASSFARIVPPSCPRPAAPPTLLVSRWIMVTSQPPVIPISCPPVSLLPFVSLLLPSASLSTSLHPANGVHLGGRGK